jgi:hypothetical protein
MSGLMTFENRSVKRTKKSKEMKEEKENYTEKLMHSLCPSSKGIISGW